MWLLDLIVGLTGLTCAYGCIVQRHHLAAVGYGIGGTLFLYAMVLRLVGGYG